MLWHAKLVTKRETGQGTTESQTQFRESSVNMILARVTRALAASLKMTMGEATSIQGVSLSITLYPILETESSRSLGDSQADNSLLDWKPIEQQNGSLSCGGSSRRKKQRKAKGGNQPA